jgi:serralysin
LLRKENKKQNWSGGFLGEARMCIFCSLSGGSSNPAAASTSAANAGNIFIDVLAARSWLDIGKDRHITYYFDEVSPAHLWTTFEKAIFRFALQEWANVANITFQEVSSAASADLFETWVTPAVMTQIWGPPPPPGGSWPAAHYLPQATGSTDGHWNNNRLATIYSQSDLRSGSEGYRLFVHEIGHALGITHSHGSVQDPGGPIFPGLPPYPNGAFQGGDFDYNQTIYTIMSYNIGPYVAQSLRYGTAMSPMAFDIAAIQFMYGANTTYRAGSDTYVLPVANEPETGWRCIWDAGGSDTIRHDGSVGATIDLRPASLVNGDPIAGGAVSRVNGIFGGFTIANGVVIENAVGGSGNDTLIGNSADNTFNGGGGNDSFYGDAGTDTAIFAGPQGAYTVTDLGGSVSVVGPQGTDTLFSIESLQFSDGTIIIGNYGALFDPVFYLSHNPDVLNAGINPLDHYKLVGWREGRDPNEFFSTNFYLGANPDARAGGNPLGHYHASGWKNGYDPGPNFDTGLYLKNNPDVAAAGINPLEHYLLAGRAEGRLAYPAIGPLVGGFDAQYYLQHNPDVAAAHIDPLFHFNVVGWHEGRNPNALFDTAGYLATYTDVAAAHINPFDHYNLVGWHEGRDPSVGFDTSSYLSTYTDVAAAHINPLTHFLQSGLHEGRSPFADGVWG